MRQVSHVLSLLVAVCVISTGCAHYVYQPSRHIYRTPANDGMAYSDLTLTASDGVRINAWYIPYPNARGTVLFCHGNAGNVSNCIQTAKLIRSLGLNVMLFDYRGYGRSEGDPSKKGTYLDALAAWDYLTVTLKQDPKTIVIHGRSLGGAIASYLALERNPGALILESTFTSVDDMAEHIAGTSLASVLVNFTSFNYDTLDNCRGMRCPTLVIHSRQDEMIPYDMGKQLYAALATPDRQFLEINGSHNTGWIDSSHAYAYGLQSFLGTAIPTAVTAPRQ